VAVITKKKLSEIVVNEIRKLMDRGELKIGDKLPNQNQFAMELGVSRTSLREAMNILDLLGAIEQKPGYGTVIRKNIPEINPEGLKPTLLSDNKTTIELLEARYIIESGTVRLTTLHATDKQVQTLHDLVEKMQAFLKEKDFRGCARIDLKLHSQIAEFSGNRFLKEAFVSIKQHMELFIQEHTQILYHVLEETQKHHTAIVKAISARNSERASIEMENHIVFLKGSYQQYYKTRTT
jgi:GntR family transcriptional regulator, transcriptional repressor for pyruvate dehydrogenase complex